MMYVQHALETMVEVNVICQFVMDGFQTILPCVLLVELVLHPMSVQIVEQIGLDLHVRLQNVSESLEIQHLFVLVVEIVWLLMFV